ncbi:MAG: DNA helicase RecG, partial [Cyanobacteriota bacterium]
MGVPPELEAWCRPLQQACQLELDRGCPDMKGRQETYSGFVTRMLAAAPRRRAAAERPTRVDRGLRLAGYGTRCVAGRRPLGARRRRERHQL